MLQIAYIALWLVTFFDTSKICDMLYCFLFYGDCKILLYSYGTRAVDSLETPGRVCVPYTWHFQRLRIQTHPNRMQRRPPWSRPSTEGLSPPLPRQICAFPASSSSSRPPAPGLSSSYGNSSAFFPGLALNIHFAYIGTSKWQHSFSRYSTAADMILFFWHFMEMK